MKKILALIVISGFFGTGLLVTSDTYAQGIPGTGQTSLGAKAGKFERHPEIRKGLRKLKAAKEDLERADHDFGGHRVAAIKAINQAISELEAALQYDKK